MMKFSCDFEGKEMDIAALFEAVFTASEGAEEGALIGHLSERLLAETPAGDRHVFIARDGEALAGCIIFTRLGFPEDDKTVFIMAPVAVATARQGQGVGQGLIAHGLQVLRDRGVDIAVTYGDPEFYSRTGFRPVTTDQIRPPLPLSQPYGWLAQSLCDRPLGNVNGPSVCVDAFNDASLW